jgi:hypothetical protein
MILLSAFMIFLYIFTISVNCYKNFCLVILAGYYKVFSNLHIFSTIIHSLTKFNIFY